MFRSANNFQGYKLEATDGEFGTVYDFLFDDNEHVIRYLVADTGGWLPGRRVLVSPLALGKADGPARSVAVNLSRAAIESSPSLDSDLPVSRRQERDLAIYYGWPYYWNIDPALGAYIATNNNPAIEHKLAAETATMDNDEHLRSIREVTGYYVEASDGEIGHIEDLIIDTEDWIVRYAVIDTKNWWPGKKVIVGFQWMESIDWSRAKMKFNAYREQIRNSPEYDPQIAVNCEYEQLLYDFYGRPKYW